MSSEDKLDDINLQVPEINIETVTETAENVWYNSLDWFSDPQSWIPVSIIIVALIFGTVMRKITRPRLTSFLDKRKLSFRMRIILGNLTKLTLPLFAMIFIIIAETMWVAFSGDANTIILSGSVKLLVAWILIRMVAQVIENNFTRQIVAMCGWFIAAISILGVMPQAQTTLDAIGMNFGDFRLSFLTIIKFIIAIFFLLTITRLIANTAERSLQNATDLTPSARVLLSKIIKIILITLAILIGVTSAGIDISALAIFGGALGLGIGFGLQKVISNLFSGMLLLIDKSIKPGDIIELPGGEGAYGWVSHLGARYVSLITRDNKEYLIPNEDFITQPVINWSYSDRKIRVETKFGVDYASDPHLIKKLAIEVATKVKRVVEDPKPVCHLVEFGDSSLNFVLRYWIEDADNGVTNTKGDVMLGLWDIFKENDIEIPFPHRVLIQKNPQKMEP